MLRNYFYPETNLSRCIFKTTRGLVSAAMLLFTFSATSIFATNPIELESITITMSPSEFNGCPGDTLPLAGILVNTDCGAFYEIEWSSVEDPGLAHLWPTNTLSPSFEIQTDTVVYQLKVTENCTQTADSVQIMIIPDVLVLTGDDKGICTDATTTIGGAPSAGVTYSWTPASGLSASTVSNPTVSFPGNFALPSITYVLTADNGAGCVAIDSVEISFYSLPNVDFEADTVCEGTATTFNNQTANPGSITSYSWLFGQGVSGSMDENPTFLYGTGGVYSASLTATSNNGCIGELTKDVLVPSMPVISGVIKSNLSDCSANNGRIVITTMVEHIAPPGVEYSIDGGTTWQFSSVFNGLAAGNYDVRVRNGGTCMATGNMVELTEPPLPIISSVDKNNPTDCSANNGDIVINATGGTGMLQYSIDGITWSSANVFEDLGQGSYPILVRNSDGTCAVNGGISMLVEPSAPVIADISKENTSNCGFGDGYIKITSMGGTGSHEYSINAGMTWLTTDSFPNLIAGVYEVSVRNVDGTCQTTGGGVTIADPASPTENDKLLFNPTDCGLMDGRIDIDASPGVGATQYSRDGGVTWTTSNLFVNLAAGTYDIFMRNGDSTCVTDAGTAVLEEPDSPVLTNVESNNPSDCNSSDGDITINATGGNGTISYSIDGGTTWEISNLFEDLASGTYDLMMRNFDGTCMVDLNDVTLVAPQGPTDPTSSSSNPLTCNGAEGSILVSLTPAMGATYQFSIDGGTTWAANGFFLGLSEGTYDVMVRNSDGTCETFVGTETLVAPPPVFIDDVTTNGMNVCAATEGEIVISASYDGVQPLDYSVDGGMNFRLSNTFSDLPKDTYNIVVRVFDGSCIVTGPEIILASPEPPIVTDILVTDVTDCGLTDGSIFIIENDPEPFEVSIDGGMTWSGMTFFSGLPGGTYSIWTRNIDGTCEAEYGVYTINAPTQPSISNVDVVQPTACGTADGEITLTISGSGFTQASIDGGATWQGLSIFSNLTDGDYSVLVRNQNGSCPSTPQILSLRGDGNEIVADVLATGTDCGQSNGVISITATGNTGNLEYSIDGGSVWMVSGTFSGLPFGNYNIAIREAGTCVTSFGVATVQEINQPVIDGVDVVGPTACDNNDGTITINASGSTGMFEYSVNNGITWQTGNTFTGLSSGLYQPMIRPTSGGCEIFGTTVILFSDDSPVVTTLTTKNGQCAPNGLIEITATATSGSLEYTIDNGGTWSPNDSFPNLMTGNYLVRVRDAVSLCEAFAGGVMLFETAEPEIDDVVGINPDCDTDNGTIQISIVGTLSGSTEYSIDNGVTWQVPSLFNNLGPGVYQAKVRNTTDGTWCESIAREIILTRPAVPNFSFSKADPTDCGLTDGRITINATGANGTLEYSLDGMTWQADNVFTGLAAGVYGTTVRYTDGSCQVNGPEITLNAPVAPTISSTDSTNPDCAGVGGSITINATGAGALEYSVDEPADWFSTNVFNNLPAGTYTIRVRNDNGSCEATDGMVTLVTPNAPVFETVDITQPTCTTSDGSITVNANIGTDPVSLLEYSVDGGTTWQSSNVFGNLTIGVYDIRIRRTDDIQCVTAAGATRLEGGDSPEILLVESTMITDCGANNGRIEVFANGRNGQPDNDIEYSLDGVTFTRSAVFTNLGPGSYDPRVRFLDGTCLVVGNTVAIVEPTPPMRNMLNFSQPSCAGNDGSITATTTGSSITEYSIDGGNTWSGVGNFTNLGAGTYTVAYRYTNGTCPVIDTTLNLNAAGGFMVTSLAITDATACDDTDGAVTITASGAGNLEYSIDGTNWQASNVFSNLAPASYTLSMRFDDGSCESIVQIFEVDATHDLLLNNVTSSNVTSCSNTDGRIELFATSAEPLEYSIDNGVTFQTSSIFDNLAGGTYTPVVRTVGFNCSITGAIQTIDAPTQLVVDDVFINHPINCGVDDGSIQIQMAPGNGSIQYSIDNGATYSGTNLFQNLGAGTYNILIRKFDGSCVTAFANNPVMIVAPTPPSAMASITEPTCDMSDGSITISAMPNSNPNNLPIEYSLDGISYQSTNVFNGLPEGSYMVHVRLENSSCKTQIDVMLTEPANCDPCPDVIRTDTIEINEADLMNPMCIPMNLLVNNQYELTLDGNAITDEGGCLPDSNYFYGYVPLITLGGSDGPFELVSWVFNGNTFSGTYNTLDDLAAALNTWDSTNNWLNEPSVFAFGGGSAGNIYGDMVIRHVRTNRTVSLQVNSFAAFAGTQVTVTGVGWHQIVATNPTDGCTDVIDIHIIATPPPPTGEVVDIYETTPMNTTLSVCNLSSFFTNPFDNPTLCGNAATGNVTIGTCTDYQPNADWVGYDEFCLVSCRMVGTATVCDTAYVHVAVTPPTDRISITTDIGVAVDTCLTDFLQLGASSYIVSSCNAGTDVTFSAQAGNEACGTLTPAAGFSGQTEVCIVHCDNVPSPLGPICDTTVITVTVAMPCTTEIIEVDTIYTDGYGGVASVCLPIPFLDFNDYDLMLDGQPYNDLRAGCDTDSIFSYLYFSFPGGGLDGPYNIAWEIDGVPRIGTVDDVNQLVDSMNVWDPAGEWEIITQIFSIIGKRNGYPAGPLTLTQINTGLMTTVMPGNSSAVNGSAIIINGGGIHSLDLLDEDNNCSDQVFIVVNDNPLTRDTIYLNTKVDETISNECLSTAEIPGTPQRIESCGAPMNGAADLNNVPCFDYTPNLGFVGNDTICLVLCDLSFPNICDTTVVIITVGDIPVCEIFTDDMLTRELDTCATGGTVCLPLDPTTISDYTFTDNGMAYTGATTGCDFDTTYLYNLNLLNGITMGTLDSWTFNGNTFSTSFNNYQEIADSMNVWDPTGNWILNPNQTISGGMPSIDYSGFATTVATNMVMIPREAQFLPNGVAFELAEGTHQIIAMDSSGCRDTLQLEVVCPNDIRDIVTDTTMNVGDSYQVCLSDFNLNIDPSTISTIVNNCNNNTHVDFTLGMADNCLTIMGLSVGQDTACYEICLTDGQCFTWNVYVNVNNGCNDFITPESSVIGVDCSKDSLFICVRGFRDINNADFNMEIDGVPYTQPLVTCGLDSTFFISYNTLPGGGTAGPYEITSWFINGVEFMGEFNDIPSLIDSFNVWDPTGDWRLNSSGVSITGGNPRNNYGTIFVEQIATGNPATMSPNTLIVATGLGFYMESLGNHTLSFLRIVDGCRDTINISTTCVGTTTIRDTIDIAATGSGCLPTNELVGGFSEIFDFCSNENGTSVIFDWSPQDTCITYEGLAVGEDQACFIVCDSLGVCDTTYYIVTVVDPSDTIPIMANPDTLTTSLDMTMVINVLGNDSFNPATDTIFITVPPMNGTASFNADGTLEYIPNPGYCSNDVPDALQYAICDNALTVCDTALVTLIVNCSDSLFVQNGFSPNNDGFNDVFSILGVERYPNNNLKVYNRWGNRVFEENGYRNTWIGDWEGVDLPDGTYYYLFDTGEGNVISGYLQIHR